MITFADHNPQTLDEAIDILYRNLDDEERKEIKSVSDGTPFHHGFGTSVRNGWGLWQGSDLKTFFETTYGLGHADDMSGIILDALVSKVHGDPFDVQVQVDYYKDYWTKKNIDPLTQKAIA